MIEQISLETAADQQKLAAWIASAPTGLAAKFSSSLKWQKALQAGLGHQPYLIVSTDERSGAADGYLPLSFVRSALFGRYLVSLPYLNSGGVAASDHNVASALIERAAQLADQLNVRYLELRQEAETVHPRLAHARTSKVLMRLELPDSSESLWKQLDPKVRNQVRKGEKHELTVHWGSHDLLNDFYRVFAYNMRDLGTPPYSRRLFRAILDEFPDSAELCVVRQGDVAIAAALLVHELGVSQVPSASSLRSHNSTNANMLMYWRLICRAIERRANCFDFGRSTLDGGTYRFKKQWGAVACPSIWQYYARQGDVNERRPDNPRYRRAIAIWQRLPVALTRLIGPPIIRGIP